jgi:hypothetical protein
VAVVAVVAAVLAALSSVANGAPAAAAPSPAAGADFETGSASEATLKAKLDEIGRAYNDANGRYTASLARRNQLDAEIAATEKERAALAGDVELLAVQAYKGGRIGAVTQLMQSRSAGEFADKAAFLDQLTRTNGVTLAGLTANRARLDSQRAELATELTSIGTYRAAMAQRRAEAQKALDDARGVNRASRSADRATASGAPTGSTATAAPRNPDGSYPSESCSLDDPTGTGGCVTPRSAHALSEARKAGFTRYTKCWRQSSGDHGGGRACDYAASPNGYGTEASGGDRAYGDRLAQFFIANASRLGVVYVIWFRRIWMPGTGWEAYDRTGGPSDVHTDHVHLSVQ